MIRSGNAENSFANQRPVKCGLCQHPFPKLAIRTAITRKSILDVLAQFSLASGIRSSHVDHLIGDAAGASSPTRNNQHNYTTSNNNSPSFNFSNPNHQQSSPFSSPNRGNSPIRSSSTDRDDDGGGSSARSSSSAPRQSLRARSKAMKGRNPSNAPSSIYTPAPICKFCAQFFGVHDVPLSEEQAAVAIELGVPLLELTKGSTKQQFNPSRSSNSPSHHSHSSGRSPSGKRKRGSSLSRSRRRNRQSSSTRRRASLSRSPAGKQRQQQQQSPASFAVSFTGATPQKQNEQSQLKERRRSVSSSASPNLTNQDQTNVNASSPNRDDSIPLQRRNTLSMNEAASQGGGGERSSIPLRPEVSFGDEVSVVPEENDSFLTTTDEVTDEKSNDISKISQLDEVGQRLFHRYIAVARKSMKGTLHHQQETDSFAKSMSMLMNPQNNVQQHADDTNSETESSFGMMMMNSRKNNSFNRAFAHSGPIGLSYEQYLENEPTAANPNAPPSNSQAMKLASGLLKRELHKLQASRLREQITKVEKEAREIYETGDITAASNSKSENNNNNNNNNASHQSSPSPIQHHHHHHQKEVKFQSPKSTNINPENMKKNYSDDDDFEVSDVEGDDDFDLDLENKKKHGEDESEAQMDSTRTPSQSRTTTAKDGENSNDNSNTRNKKSVTLQHQEKQKETAKEAEFTNQPNAKGKRFQIQMNKVENLVQHLLHRNKNDTSTLTHEKEGPTTGRNDTGPTMSMMSMMNKDKSKNLFSAPMPSASSPSTTSPYHSRIHPRNTEEEEALAADELVRAVAAAKRIQHS